MSERVYTYGGIAYEYHESPTEAPDESKRMPIGVRSIDPAEIVRQRALGWPDFHPEEFCHQCGGRNVRSWFTQLDLWNAATTHVDRHDLAILCPQCFTEAWEEEYGSVTWELVPVPKTVHEPGDPGPIATELTL